MNPATVITQISLIAAFIAGMVALFAPCCISYLLPTYFANVFRERSRVLFMTIVYSLGIFVVMMPVVLGAKILTATFINVHDQTYYLGGVFLLLVGLFSLLGIKLPMPHFHQEGGAKTDIFSTFLLGIFSGITSACCAPVLIGVVTLSSLSPTLFQSFLVGAFYVAGMVAPLYLASLFIHKHNILKNPILRKHVYTFVFLGKSFPILVSNMVAAAIFMITGLLIILLTLTGKLSMSLEQDRIRESINAVALRVTEVTNRIPGMDIVFLILIILFVLRLRKSMKKEKSCCNSLPI